MIKVCCFHCGIRGGGWVHLHHSAWVTHARFSLSWWNIKLLVFAKHVLFRKSPECVFVAKEKGKHFVEKSGALPANPEVRACPKNHFAKKKHNWISPKILAKNGSKEAKFSTSAVSLTTFEEASSSAGVPSMRFRKHQCSESVGDLLTKPRNYRIESQWKFIVEE